MSARRLGGPLDRSAPPPGHALKPFAFPEFEHLRASETLDIYLSPAAPSTAGGALLHLELLALRGAEAEPAGRAGLASLTGALLDEGTGSSSSLELADAAESLGGYLGSGADWETLEASGTFLAEHWRQGLALVGEIATDPSFPADEIERLRRRTLAELQNRRAQPGTLARRELARRLYSGTPYGTLLLGEEEAVTEILRDEIVEFHRAARASRWVAIACGGMDRERLAEEIARALPPTGADHPAEVAPVAPTAGDGRRIVLVDRPGAAQTELCVGHGGLPRTHPDFTAAGLLNTIFGGKFTSRINLNLREVHAYTYGAHSRFAARRGAGPFVVSTAVDNASAAPAAREILLELERIRSEPVAEEELADAASYLLGVFPYTVQTLAGVAARLTDLAVFGLPDDYWHTLPGRVRALTREELLRVAEQHLHPDRAVVVAVGPAAELESHFSELGPVEIVAATGH
jgi:zinc protease